MTFIILKCEKNNDKSVPKLLKKKTLFSLQFTFALYMLVMVIVLMNLLIATMSDTYQSIQSRSELEWKYGLSKLIRNMQK